MDLDNGKVVREKIIIVVCVGMVDGSLAVLLEIIIRISTSLSQHV